MLNIIMVCLPSSVQRGLLGCIRGIGDLFCMFVEFFSGLQSGSSFIGGFFLNGEICLGISVSSFFGGLDTSSGRYESILGSVLYGSRMFGIFVSCGDFASNLFLLLDGIFRVLVSTAFGVNGLRVTLYS